MECAHIPVTSYGSFSLRLHDKALGKRIPLNGSLEVTERCNLGCAHCYINQPAGDQAARESELTYQEICSIIDQVVDEGCLWLLLTGGEPFVRPDFLDIYTYAKQKGLLTTLFTNGTTITPRIAGYLAEWRPFSIEITLYGRTRETYELVTGIPGSYDRCMHGIDLLLEHNLPLELKSVILTINQHEVWEMQAYAKSLGVKFRFDPELNLRLDGGQKPAAVRIPPEAVATLDLADEKRLAGWREFIANFWGPPKNPENLYRCGAGQGSFHIDSQGQMSVCMLSRVPSYDLRSGTFHQGWYDFIPTVLAQKAAAQTPCSRCDLSSICDQCPGVAQLENGDQNAPVRYFCEITHHRARAFGLVSYDQAASMVFPLQGG